MHRLLEPEAEAGAAFFPLTVDYREYTYAAGRIPGGFIKREGRPSEREILTSRMIDRPDPPAVPRRLLLRNADHRHGAVGRARHRPRHAGHRRRGRGAGHLRHSRSSTSWPASASASVDGELIADPTYEQQKSAKLNIVVAGTESGIVMVEAGANEATEAEVLGAIEFGHECCKKIIAGIRELVAKCRQDRSASSRPSPATRTSTTQDRNARPRRDLTDALDTEKYAKLESYAHGRRAAKPRPSRCFTEERSRPKRKELLRRVCKERIFRDEMLERAAPSRRPRVRRDPRHRPSKSAFCRAPTARRCSPAAKRRRWSPPRSAPRTTSSASRLLEPGETSKRFMLHYNFPPFSVGEVGFMRGPGRREIGHGALAERVACRR